MCPNAMMTRKVDSVAGESEVQVYACSGLRVASEIPLAAPMADDAPAGEFDVYVELGDERVPPFERPSADLVAELVLDNHPWYTFCRVDDGYVGRMTGIADFVIDADLSRVVCHPVTGGRTDVIPIVLPGTITAFLLSMGGQFVLHGSAVDLGDRALGFVGVSGQGKSTMAAMFCATGAGLVTDDVLPLEFVDDPKVRDRVFCLRAGHEIRLREKSISLVDRFGPDVAVRVTADERRALAPVPTEHERLPLIAIVLPRPDRDHDEVSVRRLDAGEAGLVLSRCQRIEGWHGTGMLRRNFDAALAVVESVPVFEVGVPWGPPFAADLPRRILDACGIDRDGTTSPGPQGIGALSGRGESRP